MATLGGSQIERRPVAVNSGYGITRADHLALLDVTASGSDVPVSLGAGLPEGFSVLIHRNAASDSNVTVGAPLSRTLSGADETLEITVSGGSLVVLERGVGAGALLAANNLSDLADASTARTNLGLGTASTHADTDFVAATDATATPTASKIPIADGSGKLDAWVTPSAGGGLLASLLQPRTEQVFQSTVTDLDLWREWFGA